MVGAGSRPYPRCCEEQSQHPCRAEGRCWFIPASAGNVDYGLPLLGHPQTRNICTVTDINGCYNRYFRRVRISHRMSKHDVVVACQRGGLEITPSRAEAWARGEQDARRHIAMSEAEFEAFTRGLVDWAREAYRDTD